MSLQNDLKALRIADVLDRLDEAATARNFTDFGIYELEIYCRMEGANGEMPPLPPEIADRYKQARIKMYPLLKDGGVNF